MAVIKDGYGQIELTRVSFTRDGNIEAQCEFVARDENGEPTGEVLENGKIVAVDKAAKKVYDAEKIPEGVSADNLVYGVNYTTEKIYNQFTPGRKNFAVVGGEYPRVGILKAGDVFATNAYLEDKGEVPAVGTVKTVGAVKLLVADNEIGTADGQTAVKYQVL
jgi:hypothetical protein